MMDEKRLAEIEALLNDGVELQPTSALELVAEVRRLRADLQQQRRAAEAIAIAAGALPPREAR